MSYSPGVSLRSAILGFLAIEPTSGYTLKQRFDGSVGSFWTATQSQIYRELHALADGGLVAAESIPGDGKPDRKVYRLTDEGKAELVRWLSAPLDPLVLRHPLLLKFVFERPFEPAFLESATIAGLLMLLTVSIGLLAGRDVFRETPMAALRDT